MDWTSQENAKNFPSFSSSFTFSFIVSSIVQTDTKLASKRIDISSIYQLQLVLNFVFFFIEANNGYSYYYLEIA